MGEVLFPKTEKGDRSTTAFNKLVYADIAKAIGEQAVADAITAEKDWRHKYPAHLDAVTERLVLAGARDAKVALTGLRAGLERARALEFEAADGSRPLGEAVASMPARLGTFRVQGQGAAQTELTLPCNGAALVGDALDAQLDRWAAAGTMEPDCAEAAKRGARQVGSLKGRTFVVLGAASELGPTRLLLQAGATVVAVGTHKPKRWAELIAFTRGTAGVLLVPTEQAGTMAEGADGSSDERWAGMAGADLCRDGPAVAEWVLKHAKEAHGPVTLGTYLYADGEVNVRLTAVADFIAERLAKELGPSRISFAWLTSCSTTLVIPEEAALAQARLAGEAAWWQRLVGSPQQCEPLALEGSAKTARLFHGFEVLQGPNYALAQCMRQWRAMLLHSEGFVVSAPVTPMCRTESVCHNATMATVLDGVAHTRPLEAYEPDTCRAVMLAVLLSDLAEPVPALPTPLHLFARKAFHSGLWRCPYQMASLGTPTWLLGKVAPKRVSVAAA